MTARKPPATPAASSADFVDLDAFLDHERPAFKVKGKRYEFPGRGDLSAKLMLRIQRAAMASESVTGVDEQDIESQLLGSEWTKDKLADAGWSWSHLENLNLALLAWHMAPRGRGQEIATRILSGVAGVPTKAKRQSTSRLALVSTSTDGSGTAPSTRTRVSRSSTSRRTG